MTDLQINVNLALAMGWMPLSNFEWINLSKTGFIFDERGVFCTYEGYGRIKPFNYRDPVIFVAICKHWRLDVSFSGIVFPEFEAKPFRSGTIEKAAALCVIDAVKRGVK
jgi:hypothetical protein